MGLNDTIRLGRLRRPNESLRDHASRLLGDRISGGAEQDILELLDRIEAIEERLSRLEARA